MPWRRCQFVEDFIYQTGLREELSIAAFGSRDIVRNALSGIPGELHERHWIDFGHNHTELLRLAQEHGDYMLMIDASEVLELPPGFRMPHFNADS